MEDISYKASTIGVFFVICTQEGYTSNALKQAIMTKKCQNHGSLSNHWYRGEAILKSLKLCNYNGKL